MELLKNNQLIHRSLCFDWGFIMSYKPNVNTNSSFAKKARLTN
jgi:hypothetical protein